MTAARTGAIRNTRQRAQVSALMASIEDFRSAQQIYHELHGRGESVGLTTVYRILQSMADAGEIDTMHVSGELLYRRCSPSHHHHLVCRSCGHTVEIEGPGVEEWAEQVSASNGFTDVGHTLEIFGTCATCTSAAAA